MHYDVWWVKHKIQIWLNKRHSSTRFSIALKQWNEYNASNAAKKKSIKPNCLKYTGLWLYIELCICCFFLFVGFNISYHSKLIPFSIFFSAVQAQFDLHGYSKLNVNNFRRESFFILHFYCCFSVSLCRNSENMLLVECFYGNVNAVTCFLVLYR